VKNGTVITMTITNVPVSMNSQQSLVDCIVTVDFAELAAYHACSAAFNKAKRARMLNGTIEVRATNQRPRS
jgi:hypothetical protein